MRHLLVFLGHRSSASLGLTPDSLTAAVALGPDGKGKGKEKGRNEVGDRMAGQVVDQVLKALMAAQLDTNPQRFGPQVRPPHLLFSCFLWRSTGLICFDIADESVIQTDTPPP